jgi:hypothetical protein
MQRKVSNLVKIEATCEVDKMAARVAVGAQYRCREHVAWFGKATVVVAATHLWLTMQYLYPIIKVWGEVFPGATHGDSMSLLRVHPTRMSLCPTVVRRKVKVEQWLNIAAMSSWAGVAIGTEKRWCDCLICLHES